MDPEQHPLFGGTFDGTVNLSASEIEKIGNAMIYLSSMKYFTKTKFLKLLYLLEQHAIKETGVPFFGLNFQVWHLGPVVPEVFDALTNDEQGLTSIFTDYVKKVSGSNSDSKTYYKPLKEFSRAKFTRANLDLLDRIKNKYQELSSEEIVEITHNPESLWYKIAEANEVLDDLLASRKKRTDLAIHIQDEIEPGSIESELHQNYLDNKGY